MQLSTLFTTLTLTAVASATSYKIGNCGQATDSTKAGPTTSACNGIEGTTLCTGTGITRCVVPEASWGAFTAACKKEGFEQTYEKPGSYDDLFTAKSLAGCPRI